jgi:adenylate cyclase
MGDMINTATRIQGLSKHLGTQILASKAAVSDLQHILMRPVGDFLLVGKLEPVSVVELLARTHEATEQMALLCERFAEALDDYRNRRWRSAASRFSEILTLFPEDGPSRFYLQRCEGYLLNPPAESWQATVRVEQK